MCVAFILVGFVLFVVCWERKKNPQTLLSLSPFFLAQRPTPPPFLFPSRARPPQAQLSPSAQPSSDPRGTADPSYPFPLFFSSCRPNFSHGTPYIRHPRCPPISPSHRQAGPTRSLIPYLPPAAVSPMDAPCRCSPTPLTLPHASSLPHWMRVSAPHSTRRRPRPFLFR
jgi:hypothetical protein